VSSAANGAIVRRVQAGDLRLGDCLRTEDGRDGTITALHCDTGHAHLYTLTVARDHDFFVGLAGVLVHNATRCPVIPNPIGGRSQRVAPGSTDLSLVERDICRLAAGPDGFVTRRRSIAVEAHCYLLCTSYSPVLKISESVTMPW
jgi:hypothetical protein